MPTTANYMAEEWTDSFLSQGEKGPIDNCEWLVEGSSRAGMSSQLALAVGTSPLLGSYEAAKPSGTIQRRAHRAAVAASSKGAANSENPKWGCLSSDQVMFLCTTRSWLPISRQEALLQVNRARGCRYRAPGFPARSHRPGGGGGCPSLHVMGH